MKMMIHIALIKKMKAGVFTLITFLQMLIQGAWYELPLRSLPHLRAVKVIKTLKFGIDDLMKLAVSDI